MKVNYSQFLEKLKPYADLIFYIPLSEKEVSNIEMQVGKPLPGYFRSFLLTFGWRQDVVDGLLGSTKALLDAWENLPDGYKKDYLPIGDNGQEDYWLINVNNADDDLIYEWIYWDHMDVIPSSNTFSELLEKSLADLKANADNRIPNKDKVWSVELAIHIDSEGAILDALDAIRVSEWSAPDVSPAQVTSWESSIEIRGKHYRFTRLSFDGWDTDHFFVHIREPIEQVQNGSTIIWAVKRLEQAFREQFVLIDQGFFPASIFE